MTNYALELTTPFGVPIRDYEGNEILSRASKIVASKNANRIARCTLTLPGNLPQDFFSDDNLIHIYRQPEGGDMKLWQIYFIRKRRYKYEGGKEVLMITGCDPNHLLFRRVHAENRAGIYRVFQEPADDAMKTVVSRSITNATSPPIAYGTRRVGIYSVANKEGAGPDVTLDVSFAKVLSASGQGALGDIAKAARYAGTPVYFAVEPVISGDTFNFEFRTYVNQPGIDRSGSVTFSELQGNLEDPDYTYDATESENYIWAVGQGADNDQKIAQAWDEDSINASPFGRIEGVAEASGQLDEGADHLAQAELESRAPRETLYATPANVKSSVYGIHWGYGDRVKALYHGTFLSVIETLTLTIENGEEIVDAKLSGVKEL